MTTIGYESPWLRAGVGFFALASLLLHWQLEQLDWLVVAIVMSVLAVGWGVHRLFLHESVVFTKEHVTRHTFFETTRIHVSRIDSLKTFDILGIVYGVVITAGDDQMVVKSFDPGIANQCRRHLAAKLTSDMANPRDLLRGRAELAELIVTFVTLAVLAIAAFSPTAAKADTRCTLSEILGRAELETKRLELPNRVLMKPMPEGLAARFDLLKGQPNFRGTAPAQNAAPATRLEQIGKVPVANLVAPPGYSVSGKNAATKLEGEVIINVVTKDNQIASLDLWSNPNAVAGVLRGQPEMTIAQLATQGKVNILIDSVLAGSNSAWRHWIRAAGADFETIGNQFDRVDTRAGAEPGTISVSGNLTNFALGSRTSLGAFAKTAPSQRIAIATGTYDMFHEGHMFNVLQARDILAANDVLIVPGWNPSHKQPSPVHHRLNMIRARVDHEPKVNTYTGNSGNYMDRFGLDVFVERVKYLYGSDDIWLIVGKDAYDHLVNTGQINAQMPYNYLVFKRPKYGDNIRIPEEAKHKVRIAEGAEGDLSSTKFRNAIRARSGIPASELDPLTLDYIYMYGLYQ
jgi:nicotinic acid mononucleotide adenylyltransferase